MNMFQMADRGLALCRPAAEERRRGLALVHSGWGKNGERGQGVRQLSLVYALLRVWTATHLKLSMKQVPTILESQQ